MVGTGCELMHPDARRVPRRRGRAGGIADWSTAWIRKADDYLYVWRISPATFGTIFKPSVANRFLRYRCSAPPSMTNCTVRSVQFPAWRRVQMLRCGQPVGCSLSENQATAKSDVR